MANGISKAERALSAKVAIMQQLVLIILGILEDATQHTICPRVLQDLEDYIDRAEMEPPRDDLLIAEMRRTLEELRIVFDSS